MARITWDDEGKRYFETGTDRGVLFPRPAGEEAAVPGVAWNGLTSVTESPEGGEETPLYADNKKYLSLYSLETLGGTIEAYTYPDEFALCDGSAMVAKGVRIGQQTRMPFDLAYRTLVGNDQVGTKLGYKLHLIYGVRVSPSERAYETVNDTPAAVTFSWAFTSTAENVEGYEPTATVEIDSRTAPAANLKALEDILYGGAEGDGPRMPKISEVMEIMSKTQP